uniref:G protein signaling modulator 1 n=1 Tax=Latimeria chalumnae TaxID=7897 RepID=H3BDC3_LATCH
LFNRMEASCLELALEGERLCKTGNFEAGVAFFEAAVRVGTGDLKTLSAIYSQLGNAYFYLKEYSKALEYHKHDLTLARTIGDRIGEAKASGNLGNTLKVLGQFDEAIVCCQRHLTISREQGDKVGEARAIYNLGNVYHAKGKQLSWNLEQDPGNVSDEVKEMLQKATEFYERNLSLVKELGDRAAQGRAYGNLGNTHYLLGNFTEATAFHKERLSIAKEFGDKAAERRAYSNLGNAHIFLGRFDDAAEYYKPKNLQHSDICEKESSHLWLCYNAITIVQDHKNQHAYYIINILVPLGKADRLGVSQKLCALKQNPFKKRGSYLQDAIDTNKYLYSQIGDQNGELTAQMNIARLKSALGMRSGQDDRDMSPQYAEYEAQGARPKIVQRNSMDSLDLWKYSSKKEQNGDSLHLTDLKNKGKDFLIGSARRRKYQESQSGSERRSSNASSVDASDVRVQVAQSQKTTRDTSDEDCFFDLLSKFQRSRMDDQRCTLEERQNGAAASPGDSTSPLDEGISQSSLLVSPQTEEFFDLIASSQSRRLDDQRANVGTLPGLRITHNNLGHLWAEGDPQEPGDEFFNMLMKCQSSRIDDQRCAPPDPVPKGPTMPDEDFFSLIQRVQAKRMDEQRVDLSSNQEDDQERRPSFS